MSDLIQILISAFIVAVGVVFISQKFKISKRYERQSRNLAPQNSWNALDQGIDPSQSDEQNK